MTKIEEKLTSEKTPTSSPIATLFAKVDNNDWFAIPPSLEYAYRAAGAQVVLAYEIPQ